MNSLRKHFKFGIGLEGTIWNVTGTIESDDILGSFWVEMEFCQDLWETSRL